MDLKKKIKEHGSNITSVAKCMGITKATLSTLISNNNPTYKTLVKIADAIGITPDELIKEDIPTHKDDVKGSLFVDGTFHIIENRHQLDDILRKYDKA